MPILDQHGNEFPTEGVPFSLECRICDAGMDVATFEQAKLQGWSEIRRDDGPAWNCAPIVSERRCLVPSDDVLSSEEIRAIYIEVAGGTGNHGAFLRSFADAVVRSDSDNFRILKSAARKLIEKYLLRRYLKEDSI